LQWFGKKHRRSFRVCSHSNSSHPNCVGQFSLIEALCLRILNGASYDDIFVGPGSTSTPFYIAAHGTKFAVWRECRLKELAHEIGWIANDQIF
jgi:hypothetical protein